MIEFSAYLLACVAVGFNAWGLGKSLNNKHYWWATLFGSFASLIIYLNKDIPTILNWW